ncbi:trimeric intracellular cation channel family protein [Methanoplanus sp. FWC-SCC4]|uniref:Trimeric intracellular cation channel family protein n=1 Tax=Methanochimaera problematica TaxID=2609417 RepID=A0AA97FC41_9EURY|nr:trimeric intracellular cation channel family protein [Methanoplanus sp. FWC-SCC4]WOF16735.1 trimeric intracellular cation channel family protein [Methanoplanus sp. FWC-SCC4]
MSLALFAPDYLIGTIGIAVFAITGVLAGAKKGMDLFGIIVIGLVTAFGGGTLRDVIIDAPVFWIQNFNYVWIATTAAIIAFFMEDYFWKTYKPLLHLDAVGVALFNVQAIDKTLLLGYTPAVAVIMGLITGITGGIMRDILADRPNLILKNDLYATPILIGGILYVIMIQLFPNATTINTITAIAVVVIIRVAAIRWNLTFPKWLLFAGKESEN